VTPSVFKLASYSSLIFIHPCAGEIWITVKAKTTDKSTRAVSRKRWDFRASATGVMLGCDRAAHISINDANLSPEHAKIFLTPEGAVAVQPIGRVYLLIGQMDRSNGPVALEKDQVVKMGACSLQIADTCLHKSADEESEPEIARYACCAAPACVVHCVFFTAKPFAGHPVPQIPCVTSVSTTPMRLTIDWPRLHAPARSWCTVGAYNGGLPPVGLVSVPSAKPNCPSTPPWIHHI
jgi:hypothetical protein